MPKREDIHKVLIIGSGPIVIGQACEFDYSGTQACKALRKLGYEIVLVNSNPATIMTDPETADVTYIEPLNVERLEQIIAKERPDAVLPNLGGQSGLNLCSELHQAGILDKYNVEVIGVQVDAIERGEDRIEFKKTMDSLGIEMARSEVAYSVDEALEIAEKLGYPVVLRPAYTMGGAGGGLVYNKEELKTVCARGLQASLVGQVLVEESILGWEELELEVVRDAEGNIITVCFIENIDPLGVHTGDSFCSAPMLTISEEVQKRLEEKSHKIVESVQVIGGTNVQWAHDPKTDRDIVIEINPRTSRSSALASKATGFPIALVSAMLASGLTLSDIPCGKYGTLDKYVPDADYVVIKFARWAFEKFKGVEDKLGTQMRAVGEVMSIGKTYKEAFQKAIRSLETGRYGLGHAKDFDTKSKEELLKMLITPSSERHFLMYEALRKGATVEELHNITKVKAWFIEQMKELVEEEEALIANKGALPSDEALIAAKKDGFSDKYLSQILEVSEQEVREKRIALGLEEAWEPVHVSGTQGKNTLCFYALRLSWRLLKKLWVGVRIVGISVLRGFRGLGSGILALLRGIPLVRQAIYLYLCFVVIELLLFLLAYAVFYVEGIIVIWTLLRIVLLPTVILYALMLRKLQKGGEALATGDLSYQVDTTKMPWSYKAHGENLNRIGEGMAAAVEQRLKSERMKTELITNVSHDIKTPLTSIINYSDLIEKEQCDNPTITEYASVLHRQSERLKRLIDDLVEASKASTGNLEILLAPCEVGVMLTQTAGEYEQKLKEKDLELITKQPEAPIKILADGRRLWRVFDNLMNNVCKYAQRGTRVYLTLEEQNGHVIISFKNISREPLNLSSDELMERFVQGDTSRNSDGNGLGLSIAKSLTELQKGTMELTTDVDLFKVVLHFTTIS